FDILLPEFADCKRHSRTPSLDAAAIAPGSKIERAAVKVPSNFAARNQSPYASLVLTARSKIKPPKSPSGTGRPPRTDSPVAPMECCPILSHDRNEGFALNLVKSGELQKQGSLFCDGNSGTLTLWDAPRH